MQFTNERFKKALQRRQSKRKLTTQEQYDLKYFQLKEQQEKLEALESRVPEQMVFQFDDADKLQEVGDDKS